MLNNPNPAPRIITTGNTSLDNLYHEVFQKFIKGVFDYLACNLVIQVHREMWLKSRLHQEKTSAN